MNRVRPTIGAERGTALPSVLFERPEDRPEDDRLEEPAFFADLNLDQIVGAITAGKDEYRLKPFFYAPLTTTSAIEYRHEVMHDLEDGTAMAQIRAFAQRMRAMRDHLAQADKLYYKYQKERWFLDAVGIYCEAVARLADDLDHADLKARGLLAFRNYLRGYVASDRFASLVRETKRITAALSAIKYCLLIGDDNIKVRRYEGEADYSIDVEQTFEKFKQGAAKDYRVTYPTGPDMNHVEAQVLDRVALLYPDAFLALDRFVEENVDYQDAVIRAFDREVQFYIAYLDYVERFTRAGLEICYPRVSKVKRVRSYDAYDFALAQKLTAEGASIVCNDFYLDDAERVLVVSGPNQGGKTTFARTFGQLHYLAALGCPVAGREAHTFLFDRLFTHFEREEDITTLRGKLEDDLLRIHEILDQATSESIIIMNEIFTSTTLQDAVFLSRKIMDKIMALDALGVCVTFIDELSTLSEKTVSMVSTVSPENPALRTYKILRRPADGLAYALSIAEKHRLTYESLKERIPS